jgi:hypothetical protein
MSTLAEIEAAIERLPEREQRELATFLNARLREGHGRPSSERSDLSHFSGVVRLPEDPLAWQQRTRGEWG